MTVHRKNALRKKDKNSWNIFFEGYLYILLRNINSIESYDANESRGQTLGETNYIDKILLDYVKFFYIKKFEKWAKNL